MPVKLTSFYFWKRTEKNQVIMLHNAQTKKNERSISLKYRKKKYQISKEHSLSLFKMQINLLAAKKNALIGPRIDILITLQKSLDKVFVINPIKARGRGMVVERCHNKFMKSFVFVCKINRFLKKCFDKN